MWQSTEPVYPRSTSQTPSNGEAPLRIGSTLVFKGDLTGAEDLTIEGHLEGSVQLKQHDVTIGQHGTIKGDLYGKVIHVAGSVEGDVHGEEQIIVRPTGKVRGNLFAPRMTFETGCKIKGAVDMDAEPSGK